jgi:hypothetical protein
VFLGVWYAAGPSLATSGGARERRKKIRAMYDQIGSVEAWQYVLLDADFESILFCCPRAANSAIREMVRMFLSAIASFFDSMVVRRNGHVDRWTFGKMQSQTITLVLCCQHDTMLCE